MAINKPDINIRKVPLSYVRQQNFEYGYDYRGEAFDESACPPCTQRYLCRYYPLPKPYVELPGERLFYPKKRTAPYFEEQAKAWRKKAKIFKDYNIMVSNFSEIADRFQQIIQNIQ